MKAVWFKDAKSLEEREKVKRDFAVSGPSMKILRELIEKKMLEPVDFKKYDLAAWPYYRADCDGYNRALTEVLELIKED